MMSPAEALYIPSGLQEEFNSLFDIQFFSPVVAPLARQLGLHFKPTAFGNAQQQQMDQVRPTYESNSLADLYKRPDYTQQAWNPYGYDYAPPDYNDDDAYGFGQTNMNQNTYGMG